MVEMYSKLMDGIYSLSMWIAGISLVIMASIVPVGVFFRYVLNDALSWPEPASVMLMIVFTFLGAAVAYRAGAHIAVGMLVERLPAVPQKVLSILVDILMLAICVFVIKFGYDLCILTWDQNIAELPGLRVGITYMPLPIGSAITLLFIIERLIAGPQNARALVTIGSEEKPHSIDDLPAKEAV